MRLGLVGILALVGVFSYGNVGGVVMDHLQGLNQGCTSALSRVGPTISGPVCRGVGMAINGLNNSATSVGQAVRNMGAHVSPGK